MYHTTEKTFLTVAVIGFERTLYSVNEDDMVAVLVARVLSGALSGPVIVRVNTDDGTALGMLTVCVCVCVYVFVATLCVYVCVYVCVLFSSRECRVNTNSLCTLSLQLQETTLLQWQTSRSLQLTLRPSSVFL